MSDEDEFCFVPGGWPAWEEQAEQILNDIRARILIATGAVEEAREAKEAAKLRASSEIAFHDFLRILDAFLSQLINWAEQTEPPIRELRKLAGGALAERLLFLSAQSGR